jgi:hypothetical protein
MQHSTLGESSVNHRPLHVSPILGITLADDDDIERHPERAERSTQTHHLGVSIMEATLHDQEVEVAVRACIAASMRTEEHNLDRIGSDGRQRLACRLNDILRNHGDTVAKLPGGLTFGLVRIAVEMGIERDRDRFMLSVAVGRSDAWASVRTLPARVASADIWSRYARTTRSLAAARS